MPIPNHSLLNVMNLAKHVSVFLLIHVDPFELCGTSWMDFCGLRMPVTTSQNREDDGFLYVSF